jgi:hypothetical protein
VPASSPDTRKFPLWVKAMVRTGVSWLCLHTRKGGTAAASCEWVLWL